MALSFVAQSARGVGQPPVPQEEMDRGALDPRALPHPLARRGQPRPREGDRRLLDLRRRARHQRLDVHRAHRRLHRRRRGRGALGRGRARSRARCTAARPSRVLKMLDEVERTGDAERWVSDALDRGERLMGFGHRIYRAEDPRAKVLRRTCRELRLAALRGRRGARAGRARGAARAQARPRARDQRRVLVGRRPRPRGSAAGAVHLDVHLRAGGGLVGAHPRAEARRQADPPDGALRRRAGSRPVGAVE